MKPETPVSVEALADYAHAAWSGWMRYLFSKCMRDKDGSTTIPGWAVERWVRQMNTAYRDLPEGEKESDRAEARKILEVIHRGKKMKLEDATMTVTLDTTELIKAINELKAATPQFRYLMRNGERVLQYQIDATQDAPNSNAFMAERGWQDVPTVYQED